MDLQHWDLIFEFSLYEAACLAAGHDPNVADVSKALRAKIDLIRGQLYSSYKYAGWDTMCRVTDSAERDDRGLYSIRMGNTGYEIEEDKDPRFRREEIARWFKSLSYWTVYRFNNRVPFNAPSYVRVSTINTASKVTTTSKTDRNVQGAHQDSATNLDKKPALNKRDSRHAPQPSEQVANADAVNAVISAEPEQRGTSPQTLLRLPAVIAESGLSRSTIYNRIKEGLWPKQVSLGERASGWPASEVAALNAARIANKSDEEIRQLVVRLATARNPAA